MICMSAMTAATERRYGRSARRPAAISRSNSKFIFGPRSWLRGLIKPPPGHAVAYIDWSSQEVGIAAALSGDEAMMADFQTGDPYIAFGIRAGVLPPDATKETHRETRDMLKACVLGLQYGMGRADVGGQDRQAGDRRARIGVGA